ncbi:MAG: hypothetical protein HUJ29_01655 [Gammaproteobacteria bacterium]|nr:hypothetical protein [Gammaproteobacteria bacterium]
MNLIVNYGNTHSLIHKLEREKKRAEDALEEQDFRDLVDALFNFSITAFHIKDWLISDNGINSVEIHEFMNGVPVLQACRDICNANKHYEITRYDPGNISISSVVTELLEVIPTDDGGVDLYGKSDICVSVSGEDYRLVGFMERVIEVWKQYHQDKGI